MDNIPHPQNIPSINKKNRRFVVVLVLIIFFVITAVIILAVYFFKQYKDAQDLLKNPQKVKVEQAESLISKVGKIMDLPAGEMPTVATVTDKSKLANQPFFTKAENGDKVIVYKNAKQAIIYRPSTNKIIEVSSVTITGDVNNVSPQPTAVVTNQPTPTFTIAPSPQPTVVIPTETKQ